MERQIYRDRNQDNPESVLEKVTDLRQNLHTRSQERGVRKRAFPLFPRAPLGCKKMRAGDKNKTFAKFKNPLDFVVFRLPRQPLTKSL
jgi:hypothetical protein